MERPATLDRVKGYVGKIYANVYSERELPNAVMVLVQDGMTATRFLSSVIQTQDPLTRIVAEPREVQSSLLDAVQDHVRHTTRMPLLCDFPVLEQLTGDVLVEELGEQQYRIVAGTLQLDAYTPQPTELERFGKRTPDAEPKPTDADQVKELFSRRVPYGHNLSVICAFDDSPAYIAYGIDRFSRGLEITNEEGAVEIVDFYDHLQREYGTLHELYTFQFPTRTDFVEAALEGMQIRVGKFPNDELNGENAEYIKSKLEMLLNTDQL